jgi:hypothetical protein
MVVYISGWNVQGTKSLHIAVGMERIGLRAVIWSFHRVIPFRLAYMLSAPLIEPFTVVVTKMAQRRCSETSESGPSEWCFSTISLHEKHGGIEKAITP